MPELSHRVAHMPQSPIRKLVPYALKAKEKGIKIYHLNIGQPDISTHPAALQAIRKIDFSVWEYSLSEGEKFYRKSLAKYYQSFGVQDIGEEHFLVTNGGSEAINFALATICDAGDEIVVPEPYYANYNGFATALDVKVKAIESHLEEGFALPKISEFEKKISPKTKAILICNPGNPTGYLYSKEELLHLRDIVLKHDIFLIADEVYREYVYDGEKHHSILTLEGLENHAIVVDSESKRFSMCGARVGYMVTKNKKVHTEAMKFAQARLSPVSIGQIAATAAHEDTSDYLEQVKIEYQQRRDLLVAELRKIPGVVCPTPKGAFYCMAQLPVKDTDEFAKWMLSDFHYENETVMLAPASGFYSRPTKGKNQVRLAYVLKMEDLERSVEILRRGLEKYNS